MANVGDINPQSGGIKIPQAVKDRTRNRILAYADKHFSEDYTRIDVRFKGQFCYIDAYTEPNDHPDFLAALFGESREEYIERLQNLPIHLWELTNINLPELYHFQEFLRHRLTQINTDLK